RSEARLNSVSVGGPWPGVVLIHHMPGWDEWIKVRKENASRRAERLLGLLVAGKRLHPEGQPRELFADKPQVVLRAGFVEPVDQPDQRADMLLGQLKETLGALGRHRTSSGRTAMLGHGASMQINREMLRLESLAREQPNNHSAAALHLVPQGRPQASIVLSA